MEWCVESFVETKFNMNSLLSRLQQFMKSEARLCSMDFGCITPLYVYRMWGGQVALNEIEFAFHVIKCRA